MTIEEKTLDSDEEILHLMGSSITVRNIENLLNVITAHNKDKSEEDSIDSVIENYFGDANYAHTTTHYEDFESAIMRLCAYEVIKRDYNIEECWYIKEGNLSRTAKKLPPLFPTSVFFLVVSSEAQPLLLYSAILSSEPIAKFFMLVPIPFLKSSL